MTLYVLSSAVTNKTNLGFLSEYWTESEVFCEFMNSADSCGILDLELSFANPANWYRKYNPCGELWEKTHKHRLVGQVGEY
jgi:hypothetical protein